MPKGSPAGCAAWPPPAVLPRMPTMKEEGVGDCEVTAWFAAYFPRNTPPDIVQTMQKILAAAHRTQAFSGMLHSNGLEALPLAGNALTELNRKEIDKWKRAVQAKSAK